MPKTLFPRIMTMLLVVVAVTAYVWLNRTPSFEVKGRIAGFSTDTTKVIIEHEEIPGYMMAMTMPFKLKNPEELSGLNVGDAVAFRYVVTRERSWIEHLHKVDDALVAKHPAGKQEFGFDVARVPVLAEGDVLPTYTLVDQDGVVFTTERYAGKKLVLTFIYTSCPVPDYCPLMTSNFVEVQRELLKQQRTDVHLLSVSFDVLNDSPDVLRAYGNQVRAQFDTWNFATGTAEQIQAITGAFNVLYEQDRDQIVHNLRTVLVDEKGIIRNIWSGNDWRASDVLSALK